MGIRVLLIVMVLLVLQYIFIVQYVRSTYKEQQIDELSRYVTMVKQDMDDAYMQTEHYDQMFAKQMYLLAKAVRLELKGVSLEEIDPDHLLSIKEAYNLTGLAIFQQTENDIKIAHSTTPEEVGASTEKWGYWRKTFENLFDGQAVATKKGFTFDQFWMGPKALSHYYKGYYRFGYIYHEEGNYLINPYVKYDEQLATFGSGGIEESLKNLKENISYIEHVGIVDAEFLKQYKTGEYDSASDPLVIYGDIENTGFTKIDYDVDTIMNTATMTVKDIRDNRRIAMARLNNDHMLIIVLKTEMFEAIIARITAVFIALGVAAGTSILLMNYWMIRRYDNEIGRQKERLELANAFKKTIQSMPDMIYHCRLSETGAILLTYNDGVYFDEDQIILTDKDAVPIENIYSPQFMRFATEKIMESFGNKRIRFETSINGRVYDNILTPMAEAGADEKTGYVREIIGFATDITDRVKKERILDYRANRDALTKLPNRFYFKNQLSDMLELHNDLNVIVMYFDMNGFKEINDTYGHQIGDAVLKTIGMRFNGHMNKDILIARFGGDEFVACCTNKSLMAVEILADRIVKDLEKPMVVEGISCQVGVTFGIAQQQNPGQSVDDLIDEADQAMYAKRMGHIEREITS